MRLLLYFMHSDKATIERLISQVNEMNLYAEVDWSTDRGAEIC